MKAIILGFALIALIVVACVGVMAIISANDQYRNYRDKKKKGGKK